VQEPSPIHGPRSQASYHFIPSRPPSLPWRMSHQSLSSRFRGLFDAALQDYKKTTSITLVNHPLAEQLQNCHSVESITTFLQDQVREFGCFQRRDEMMKSIKNTVSSLCALSATTAIGGVVQLVCDSSARRRKVLSSPKQGQRHMPVLGDSQGCTQERIPSPHHRLPSHLNPFLTMFTILSESLLARTHRDRHRHLF